MKIEDREKITSNDYINIVTEYARKDRFMKELEGFPINIIDTKYGVIYYPTSLIKTELYRENSYSMIPKLYGLLDTVNLDKMGVSNVQNVPRLALKGEGVLLGFVDTGIDYTNPAFKSSDGKTRIISIWDQSINNLNADKKIFYYGKEYSRDQIDEALLSDNPLSIVPSTDEIGHGTMLAGIAGGTRNEENDFQGVVPSAEFVVVKLKESKKYLRDYFFIPDNVPSFQQDDIMFGLQYLMNMARYLNRPIAICIGIGTNQSSHDGLGILEDFLSYAGTHTGRAFIIAGGNEGNSKSHYFGIIDKTLGYDEVELVVDSESEGFFMELWGKAPNTYAIDILSPSGQYIPQIVGRLGESRKIDFIFENTVVIVDYILIEGQTGDPFILIRFMNPAKGVWKFKVYARGLKDLNFHMWLPLTGFIPPGIYFNNADPYTTITSPGNAFRNTTVTAYDSATNAIYINASRGYTSLDAIAPDFAAPGVNVLAPVPGPGNRFARFSGTSVATAHTTGLAAMLFEWGIVKGDYMSMSSSQIERFLIRGVQTDPALEYPNRTWGNGIVNIYNTFLSLNPNIQI